MRKKLLLIMAIVALLTFPKIIFGQAPNLGTAANFVLFTRVGAVTNSGTPYLTKLTGNVGSNSGTSTGFGNVDGVMHDGDLASGQCSADLLTAYNQLNATVATLFPAPLLGNGQVLTPGVYSIPSPATLNLGLTFDALGNPNAVFIIRIAGSFSTNASSKVYLTNGALACNIFWQVEGMVNMASGTFMRGTIIANNAAINMSVGDTLEGRALSTTGAITTNAVLGYTPVGCGSPVLAGPTAPALSTVECFAIFTSIGNVTNTGVSMVTGDIGTNSGLTTGFNPLNVNGTIHPIPDGFTLQCESDLLAVYAYLNALPYDIELLYPAQFGHNLVLTPHTYLLNAATTFTDSIYLNAMGNVNAVFVIKLYGALSTSTYSKVKLINGTQAKNVYWLVTGAVSIGDFSEFKGTIICNNGAINLLPGMKIDGRLLSTVGAFSCNAITAIITPGCNMFCPKIITQPINQTTCVGGSASFFVTATGSNLNYQWRKGTTNLTNTGNISGANSDTLVINPVSLSDSATNYNVLVSETALLSVTSDNASLIINPLLPVSITINTPINPICTGTPATFTAIPINGGTIPAFQWKVNGLNAGTNNNVFIYTPMNGDIVSCVLTSNESCIYGNPASSNAITMIVNSSIPVSATIIASENPVCIGTLVNYTATPINGGETPVYQWKVNGINVGINSSTYSYIPLNGDLVNVVMTSSLSCGTGNPATSNIITMVVGVSIPATVSIVSSENPVCAGVMVTYSAIPYAEGATPLYQWKVNGLDVGINSPTYSYLPLNGDLVNLVMTSSLSCATGNPVTSNIINMIVNSNLPAPIINGIRSVCVNSTGNVYSAQSGMTNYLWYVSPGGNITAGSGTNAITVNWIAIGSQAASVNFMNTIGCPSETTSIDILVNDCASDTVDLSIVKIADKLDPPVGHNVIFTITANNNGPHNATGVFVNDILQNGYSYVSSSTKTGTFDFSSGVWTIGNMNYGTSATLTIVATIVNDFSSEVNYVNSAYILGTEFDPNMVNNTSTITLYPKDFFIPEGFSPNGDGINEFFVIRGINQYPNNTFKVYNRWGKLVFEASPYMNTWDGSCNIGIGVGGEKLPTGTYFYTLDLKNSTDVYKGTIYLNR